VFDPQPKAQAFALVTSDVRSASAFGYGYGSNTASLPPARRIKPAFQARARQNAGLELTAKARVLANDATTRCRFNFVAVPKGSSRNKNRLCRRAGRRFYDRRIAAEVSFERLSSNKDSRKDAKTQSSGVRPLRLRAFANSCLCVRTENSPATRLPMLSQLKTQEFSALDIGHESGTSNPSFILVTFPATAPMRDDHLNPATLLAARELRF
jgi:hypothetical protein